jgi:hypothetical protein
MMIYHGLSLFMVVYQPFLSPTLVADVGSPARMDAPARDPAENRTTTPGQLRWLGYEPGQFGKSTKFRILAIYNIL